MSQVTTLYCDICGQEIKDYHSSVHISMSEVRSCTIKVCSNEVLDYKDTCYACRGSLMDLIESLKRGTNE